MKNFLFIIILFFLTSPLFSQNSYYISYSTGNDNNNGKSESKPWKTIGKVNSINFQTGDKILFKRNDRWENSTGLKIKNSGSQNNPITYSSYGNGNLPIISLLNEIPNWKDASKWKKVDNNIWELKIEGYLASVGIFRMWFNLMQYKRAETIMPKWLTSPSNSNIPLKPGNRNSYSINNEYRFYQDNNKLYVFSSKNPSSNYSSLKTNLTYDFKHVVNVANVNFVTIEYIDIRGGHRTVRVEGSKNIKIRNCNISYSSHHGISVRDNSNSLSENIEVMNCKINGRFGDLYGGEYKFYSTPYTITPSFLTVNIGVAFENGVTNSNIHNNTIKDFHFAHIRFYGQPGHPTTFNSAYDNLCYSDSVSTSRFAHVAVGNNPNNQLGWCSNNRIFRNYARNTRLNFELAGDHNLVYFNIIDHSIQAKTPVYSSQGVGISLERANPEGMTQFNFVFNNTLYKLAKKPIGSWPQKGCGIFNNLIINSGTGSDNIWLGDGNKGTLIKNNLIYFNGKTANDIVCQFSGKGLTISQFNNISANYNEIISGNILYPGNMNNIISNPENQNFSLVSGSPALNAGVDISKYVPSGFKDMSGNVVNRSNPNIGAYGTGGSVSPSAGTELKVYLEGSFDEGQMLPLLKNKLPNSQPYNRSPWNYSGNEAISSSSSNYIDWLLIELRSSLNTVSKKFAALLRNDGRILNFQGTDNFSLYNIPNGDYYVVVYHRNHIPVFSSNKISVTNSNFKFDFTNSESKVLGINSLKDFGNNKFGMLSGDTNADGVINNLDFGNVANFILKTGYLSGDLNMDGVINVLDYSTINSNYFKESSIPQ